MGSCANHWNGVCGLGTKELALTVRPKPRRPLPAGDPGGLARHADDFVQVRLRLAWVSPIMK